MTKTTKQLRLTWKVRNCVRKSRKRAGGRDEVTGKLCATLECHHILTVSKHPGEAHKTSNTIMISADIHREVVHKGNFDLLEGMPEYEANAYKGLYCLAHEF